MTTTERRAVALALDLHEQTLAVYEKSQLALRKVITEYVRDLPPADEAFRAPMLASITQTLDVNIPGIRTELSKIRASLGVRS